MEEIKTFKFSTYNYYAGYVYWNSVHNIGENRRAINNRQSRDAGITGYTIVTQYDDKQSKKHKTESYKNEQYRPTTKRGWTHDFTKVNDFNLDVYVLICIDIFKCT
jgi:hypothetical protein